MGTFAACTAGLEDRVAGISALTPQGIAQRAKSIGWAKQVGQIARATYRYQNEFVQYLLLLSRAVDMKLNIADLRRQVGKQRE
jgi:hypothetical protein